MLRPGIRRAFRLGLRRHDLLAREIREELERHLELSVEQLTRSGLSESDARAEARRRLAPIDKLEQSLYTTARRREERMRIREWIDAIRLDFAYAGRGLRRQPGLTAVIVGTLTLGIGANAAIFPMLDRLLFRAPSGIENPQTLRRVYTTERGDGRMRTRDSYSYPEMRDIESALRGTAAVAGYGTRMLAVAGDTAPEQLVGVAYATSNLLPLLGVRLERGRFFGPDEDRVDRPELVAVIGYDLWSGRFGADPALLGRKVKFGARAFTVVGVLARGFHGIDVSPTEVWLPLATQRFVTSSKGGWWESRDVLAWGMVARLGPGSTEANAERMATAGYRDARRATGRRDVEGRVQLGSIILARGPKEPSQERLIMTRLAGLSLLLLVIAVLNVGNLLLARGARREREVAVRRALGISRARLALMWMLEALLVAMLAAVAATIVSTMLGGVLRALIMPETKWTPPVADARAILFTSLLAAICTAVCGSLPALRFGGDHAAQWLRAGTRAPDRSTTWLRTGFLVAQAALSAVLLIGAGLFVTSLERVKRVDVGYDLRGLAAVSVMGSFSAQRAALEAASTRLRGLPDVEGTALVTTTPLRGLSGYDTYLPNSDSALGDGVSPDVYGVSPEFFRTAGLTLIRGRPFTAADGRGAPRVIVVSQHMAETLWPGASPIGSCVRFVSSASNCYTVIGVARNARRFRVVEQPVSQAWIAVDQLPDSSGPRSLMIRSRGDVRTAAKLAEDELTGVLGAGARPATFFYDTWLDPQLRSWRLGTRLFTGVAVVALALAVIGLYSVLSFSVAQRTRELGVRIALGADVAALVGLVLGQGLRAVVIGLVIGLALAAAAGTLIESLLYDTSLYDPTVYGAVALTLIVAGSMAAAIPAVRAGRVDPAESLRAE